MMVSPSTDDKKTGTFYDSTAPVIGGRGGYDRRYVAFVSSAVGLGGSSGKFVSKKVVFGQFNELMSFISKIPASKNKRQSF